MPAAPASGVEARFVSSEPSQSLPDLIIALRSADLAVRKQAADEIARMGPAQSYSERKAQTKTVAVPNFRISRHEFWIRTVDRVQRPDGERAP